MRLISFGLIGLMVISGFLWVEQLRIDQLQTAQQQRHYIDMVVEHALEDAVRTLKQTNGNLAMQRGAITIDHPMQVIDAFFKGLANSLGMQARGDLVRLSSYVPYIVMVDPEGYYLYTVTPGVEDGYNYQRSLLPRVDFYHEIDHYYIFLGQGDRVRIMNRQSGEWQIGYRNRTTWLSTIDNLAVREFLSQPDYQAHIDQLKLDQLESDLSYYCNVHSNYAKARGIYYDFSFESIAGSWTGVVKQPTLMAAVQGMPLSGGAVFDHRVNLHYSLMREVNYYGFIENGVKYYAVAAKLPIDPSAAEAVFSNPQQAARAGYFPYE